MLTIIETISSILVLTNRHVCHASLLTGMGPRWRKHGTSMAARINRNLSVFLTGTDRWKGHAHLVGLTNKHVMSLSLWQTGREATPPSICLTSKDAASPSIELKDLAATPFLLWVTQTNYASFAKTGTVRPVHGASNHTNSTSNTSYLEHVA